MSAFRLSEDWLATLVGLLIVFVVGFGLLGPGALEVRLTAQPGETVTAEGRALDGWSQRAALDGETIEINRPEGESLSRLSAQTTYSFICEGSVINAAPPSFDSASYPQQPPPQLTLTNNCDAPVTLTYRRSNLIRWPLFGLFQ